MLARDIAIKEDRHLLPDLPALCRFAADSPKLPEGADLLLFIMLLRVSECHELQSGEV